MAREIKAGVEHIMKVNTKADKMGLESGFSLRYFNDQTKTMTTVDAPFFEFEDEIIPTSTTIIGDHPVGATEITLADVTNFVQGSSCKIGGNYYRILSVSGSVITLRKGLLTAVTDGDTIELSGRTGTYGVPVTFPNPGNYTIHITNFAVGMDNEAAPIKVVDATIEDVNDAIEALQADLTAVKAQVDTLDEEELNGISEQVNTLSDNLAAVHRLIKDSSDVYFEVTGDETSNITVDSTITGDTSGATGVVQSVVYDAETDRTKVTVQSVTGTFAEGETVNNGTASTTGTIDSIQNNVINSVYEFVEDLKQILEGDAGVANLLTINKDIQHLMLGDATLENGDANPTAGKGLTQIFDELVSTHSDVTAIKTLAEDATVGFNAIKTAVVDARASIEGKIDALVDESNNSSLISKINAVKSIVDANKALLEDGTNGLASIMTGINDIAALFADGGDIELRIDAIDTALSNLDTALSNQTAHIDNRFDQVMNKLGAMEETTKYTVFA